MGWGGHPDTMTIACAQGIVRRQGIEEGTLDWQKAFRVAYKEAAGPSSPGLEEHLERLDEAIRRREAGQSLTPFEAHGVELIP